MLCNYGHGTVVDVISKLGLTVPPHPQNSTVLHGSHLLFYQATPHQAGCRKCLQKRIFV